MRKKDVVLMATVTNFETVPHPSKTDLRQFAELFMPLFNASTEEAKREAIAALSQHPNVPSAVAFFIACQPISIAAPFLISSKCLDDDTLITIARTQGAAHARAIVRREDLSPTVIDALVSLRHMEDLKRPDDATPPAMPEPAIAQPADVEIKSTAVEEEMRQRIKRMAHQLSRPESDVLGLRRLSDVQEALLVRFARERDARQFAVTLADLAVVQLLAVGAHHARHIRHAARHHPDRARHGIFRSRLHIAMLLSASCRRRRRHEPRRGPARAPRNH